MKVVILGAGFTGLTAALRLLQAGHEVIVLEKEERVGGLAAGFSRPGWKWPLEKAYHHWFTNDSAVLNLSRELNHPILIVRPSTEVFIENNLTPFDSPVSLLKFSYLPFVDRLRTGVVTLFLKLSPNLPYFETQQALPWLNRFMGKKVTSLIWEPLFSGKFGNFKEEISLTWFWARIKKRTPSLAYPEGGFEIFAEKLAAKVRDLGGKIILNTEVTGITSSPKGCTVKVNNGQYTGDKVISTLPSPIFSKITKAPLPKIAHLHALNLILVLKKPFMKKTYWLNITDKNFPFLVLAEHTNFMNPKHYGGEHLLYIGNYLPEGHPYLKMSAQKLFKVYEPFLKKINPTFNSSLLTLNVFFTPFAQPIVDIAYKGKIPDFHSPLKNIYLANMDMVYPWDRGTNYAVELGEKVATMVKDEAA